jgi:23S rRNA pseudouridine1911/1915/1917 synthase
MRVIPGGLESRTDVTVLDVRGKYALVSCELLTGRQHQIRVHLACLGCPVVGDKLYGPDERILARAADRELTDEDRERLELSRHALHAHRYRMPHAVTGEDLDLVSPLPPDLQAFWESRPA